jgi:hypothetical protein
MYSKPRSPTPLPHDGASVGRAMTSPLPHMGGPIGAEARAEGSIADWLLHGPAQLRSGPHAGAVAGTVTAAGAAAYVYPEIAGYYLQWLAWRAQRHGGLGDLRESAAAVQRWLNVWLAASDPPPTRLYLDGTTDDWRNRAVFFFDIAMVLRGLGSAAHAGIVAPDAAVIGLVTRQLERLVAADGQYDACAMNVAGDAFPARWSTRRGAFLTKAAAGIVTAATQLPGIAPRLVHAAQETFVASIASLEQHPHREAHPLLYAFEGVLALPGHRHFAGALATVARQYDGVLARASADGFLPETLGPDAPAGPERVDVLAQTLRIGGLLVAHRPQQPPDQVTLARLRAALARQVKPVGAVTFARAADAAQWNVWAAMFADQALDFATPVRDTNASWRNDPLLV